MTNIELALKLQALSVHLQEQPEVEIGPVVLSCESVISKENFLALVKTMPRPISKRYTDYFLWVETKDAERNERSDVMPLSFAINRETVCRLVQPAVKAVYECDPLLSPEEEAALTEV